MDRLVLIDGNAFIHRAYHAYPFSLLTSEGELVNAVYGFTSILLTIFQQLKPKYALVAFDRKEPTFRHKIYAGYKAHRPKMDKELINQFSRIYEIVQVLNIPIFEKSGFEADDVLGTLAKQSQQQETVIATGDQDILQLINQKTKVFFPSSRKKGARMINEETFKEKYGFPPQFLIDFKALAGDSADEIPGVKGVGPKTAQKLIQAWGNLENIYQNLKANISFNGLKNNLKKKLLAEEKTAFLSRKLATIITNVPLNLNLQKCQLLNYNQQKAEMLFKKLEFNTLIKKLPPRNWQEKKENIKTVLKKEPKKQMALF